MEPITVVSLIATIIQLINTTSKVVKYLNDMKNAPRERAELAREITNLLPLLTDLRYRMGDTNLTEPWFAGLHSLGGTSGPLEAFKDALGTHWKTLLRNRNPNIASASLDKPFSGRLSGRKSLEF